VTDKKGKLKGKRALFAAPEDVRSVVLKLVVTDGGDLIGEDTIVVNTLENVDRAYFVDGDNGSDSAGDGSVENPYATIGNALARVNDRQDIYTMNRKSGGYTPTTLRVPTGTSLYGGYDKNWVRAPFNDKTVIRSRSGSAVEFNAIDQDTWFSGFELYGGPGSTSSTAIALFARGGGATLYVLHNQIVAGNGAAGTVDDAPGSSVGIALNGIQSVHVFNNTIRAGFGGRAFDRPPYASRAASGGNGANGSGASGGDGGGRRGASGDDGGDGGNAGTGLGSNGSRGNNGSGGGGGRGGSGNFDNLAHSGGGGSGGSGGDGGQGGGGEGSFFSFGLPQILRAEAGTAGSNGLGGGGGGGGEANLNGVNGGGGGGGGAGGDAGAGGVGAYNGGASVGVALTSIPNAVLESNVISADRGGDGGNGGGGQGSGDGGNGGIGARGNSTTLGGTGGSGRGGGGGGKGGSGGQGGGGGGGPSYGIVVLDSTGAAIDDNDVVAGTGGSGGTGGTAGLGGQSGQKYSNEFLNGGAGARLYSTSADLRGETGSNGEGGWSRAIYSDNDSSNAARIRSRNRLSDGQDGADGQMEREQETERPTL